MTAVIAADRLHSIGVVVKDLERAAIRYAEILGIDHWEVRNFDAVRVTDAVAHGRPVAPTFRTAIGTTSPPPASPNGGGNAASGVTFELIQPLRGESPFQELRFVRGQGVSHLTLAVRGEDEYVTLKQELAESGIGIAASMTIDGQLKRHFIDTRAALGGFLIEVQEPLSPGAENSIEVSETWDLSGRYTRPDGVGPVEVQRVHHFGVVVNDVMASLRQYNNLLGISAWAIRDWRTEPGLLEGTHYRGKPVDHEYFTGLAAFRDFGFEIIQPTLGPSHYNREFRDLWGEGIHHMLLTITADQKGWDNVGDWLASIDVPLVMGADLGRAATFCYHDTFKALGGYILEAVLVRETPAEGARQPEYVIDFAALTADL